VSTNRAISDFRRRPLPFAQIRARRCTLPACLSWARRLRALLITILPLISFPLAAQQRPTEAQVKAAYLFNFGKFVKWQRNEAGGSESLQICILGKDPFGTVLDSTVAGESVDGKTITVKRIVTVPQAPQCRILFISLSEEHRLRPILAAAQRSGALTVSDIPHFAELGGIIEFTIQQDRIRFEVNRAVAEQCGLILSSQLLKVASKVIEETPRQNQP
jgi:hypothetical protein